MSLLVRAIVRARDLDRAAAPGTIAIRAGDLAALASPVDAPVGSNEEALRAHDALTRRIHEDVASLPARYGQVFESERDVVAAIEPRAPDLRAGLATVEGRVEMAVTLRWRASERSRATDVPASGRDYLERRAADLHEHARAERIVGRLLEEMACERAHVRSRTCPRPGVAAIVALLIDRDEMRAARERVLAFGERSGDVSAAVDGVFAPYSFAS